MKTQVIVVLALGAAVGVAQLGAKVNLNQKPVTLSAGAMIKIPNQKLTKINILSPAVALKLANDAGQKVQSLELTATVTPDKPHHEASGLIAVAQNAALVVPGNTGNWVFTNQSGGFMVGAKVPSGTKFAVLSVAGLSDVNAKAIRVMSGSSTTSHEFGSEAGTNFNKSTLINVDGKDSFGAFVTADIGKSGTIWVSNLTVQFLK